MKTRKKAASKIPTTQTNTNRKVSGISDAPKKIDMTLIRKNEFAAILIGALVLTLIVFFVFFRTPDETGKHMESKTPEQLTSIESRLALLEDKTASFVVAASGETEKKDEITLLNQRVSRLETAFSLKFDSMLDRLAGLEKRISEISGNVKTKTAKVQSIPVQSPAQVNKTVAVPKKKAVKKNDLFHTVKKGETLYSISKKYNTTVSNLRKLNNLSNKATIYPGNNILVR